MSTHPAVLTRMHAHIAEWETTRDPRVIFLTCYSLMTANMLTALNDGAFHNRPWVDRLLHRFADYYFDALTAYEQQPTVAPPVWQLAFDAARQPNRHVLQHLVLGVNAHINYDLVFVVHELNAPDWHTLNDVQRQARYADHCQVNTIIYETIDRVQDEVIARYSPAMQVVDLLGGRFDELLIRRWVTHWREEVWEDAQRLLAAPDATAQAAVREAVETRADRRARAVLGERGLLGFFDLIS